MFETAKDDGQRIQLGACEEVGLFVNFEKWRVPLQTLLWFRFDGFAVVMLTKVL